MSCAEEPPGGSGPDWSRWPTWSPQTVRLANQMVGVLPTQGLRLGGAGGERNSLQRASSGVSFSGRRGIGRWPTGPEMDHFPAGARSPTTTPGTRVGGHLVKRASAIGEFAVEPSLRLVAAPRAGP
jgi:hypothetical protein